MKNISLKSLLAAIIVMTTSFACTMNKTSTGETAKDASAQDINMTPEVSPARNPDEMGIGPVLPQESNFYFGGIFDIREGTTYFYDCITATYIPIDTEKGDYQNIVKRYKDMTGNTGNKVFIQFRGYFISNKNETAAYPYTLVMTYLNDMQISGECSKDDVIAGTWECSMSSFIDTKSTLILGSDYNFTYKSESDNVKTKTKGSWLMSSGNRLFLNYLTFDPHLGHTAMYNEQTKTLFVTTEKGTLIFKKK